MKEGIDPSAEFPIIPLRRGLAMSRIPLDLTAEQRDEAGRIEQRILALIGEEIRGIAELLASKPDRQILGEAEFQVRDRVHRIGARAIETALDERKKGATKGPASPAPAATAPANSSADRIDRSSG